MLEAAGSSLEQVVKTTVFLADMKEFSGMNEVYATFFPSPPPARATVAAAGLPRDARVEIEAVALVSDSVSRNKTTGTRESAGWRLIEIAGKAQAALETLPALMQVVQTFIRRAPPCGI